MKKTHTTEISRKKEKKINGFMISSPPPAPMLPRTSAAKRGKGGGGPTVPSNRVSLAMALHWDARPEAKVNLEALLLL